MALQEGKRFLHMCVEGILRRQSAIKSVIQARQERQLRHHAQICQLPVRFLAEPGQHPVVRRAVEEEGWWELFRESIDRIDAVEVVVLNDGPKLRALLQCIE